MNKDQKVINWLMEGDPAIKWQVERDLLDLLPEKYNDTRKKVATEGWGNKLLSFQDPEGTWAKGLYNPKWISTTYTLLLLIRLGLPRDNPQVQKACQILLDKGIYSDGGINFSSSLKYSEMCITGMILKISCYFQLKDPRIHTIFNFIEKEQMNDHAWNCQKPKGAIHSSFHTTISVLEGLLEYEKAFPERKRNVDDLTKLSHEFLLDHHLYQSHRTGKPFDKRMTRISFPPRWRADFCRILEYFQQRRYKLDPRMNDAIELLRSKQKKNGLWNQGSNWPGKTFFDLDEVGKPGRMNTLRALRILKWWDGD